MTPQEALAQAIKQRPTIPPDARSYDDTALATAAAIIAALPPGSALVTVDALVETLREVGITPPPHKVNTGFLDDILRIDEARADVAVLYDIAIEQRDAARAVVDAAWRASAFYEHKFISLGTDERTAVVAYSPVMMHRLDTVMEALAAALRLHDEQEPNR